MKLIFIPVYLKNNGKQVIAEFLNVSVYGTELEFEEAHISETKESQKAYLLSIYYGSNNDIVLLYSHNIPACWPGCSCFLHRAQFAFLQMSALREASWKKWRRLLSLLRNVY